MGKSVLFCVEDHFQTSKPAFVWALENLVTEDDEVHVVTVLPPLAYSVTPVAPLATAGAVSAVTHQWEAQKKADELRAADTLKMAVEAVKDLSFHPKALHTHALPALGGASGVGASIVEYANSKKFDAVVVGSRGHGALKMSLLSVVGLGSVSDHAVHNLHCPVLVLSEEGTKRNLCIACDASDHSKEMFQWVLNNLMKPDDNLHIITVASPVNYPILDDTSPAVCALETKQWQEAKEESLTKADATARAAVDMANKHGVPLEQLWFKSLIPEGGASGVGESICHYVEQNHNQILIVGNRGLGAFQRAMTSFLGLGSVGDYCTHHAPCPVLVFKH